MSRIRYRPEVDGLRAVAVLAVVMYHARLGLSGGYVGVDVFFVLSGFLITSLILHEMDEGTFSRVGFWERRVRRILPAMVFVILGCCAAAWVMLFPVDFVKFGESVAAQGVLSSNLFFWHESGYFVATEFQPLLHTWSLAVEEQFYLLFPFFLLLVVRHRRTAVAGALGAVAVLSLGFSVYATYADPRAAFYSLPSRAWELALGAWLATRPAAASLPRWLTELVGLVGLVTILAAAAQYTVDTRFPGVAALLPCLGTAAVIWSNQPERTVVGRFLALRPMVFVGLISYSLYLWHWPVLNFLGYWAPGALPTSTKLAGIAGTFVLAVLSWRFIEVPFRRRTLLPQRGRLLAFGAATMATLVVVGVTIRAENGFDERWRPDALQFLAGRDDEDFRREVTIRDIRAGRLTELGLQGGTRPVDLLVWGDSHAMAVLHVLDRTCAEHHWHGLAATHSMIPPLLDYPSRDRYSLGEHTPEYNQAVMDFVATRHVRAVLLAAAWNLYLPPTASDGEKVRFQTSLHKTVSRLVAAGVTVYLLEDVPHQPFDVPRYLAIAVTRGVDPATLGVRADEDLETKRHIQTLFAKLAGPMVHVLNPEPLLTDPSGICPAERNGRALYFDAGHLSISGEMLLRPLFRPMFEANGGPSDGTRR